MQQFAQKRAFCVDFLSACQCDVELLLNLQQLQFKVLVCRHGLGDQAVGALHRLMIPRCLASKPSGHRLFNMLHIWLMTLRHSSFYNISCLARRSVHPFETPQTANLYRKTTAISSKLRWSWRRRRDLNPRGSYPTLLP